jgi:hypothetical protein
MVAFHWNGSFIERKQADSLCEPPAVARQSDGKTLKLSRRDTQRLIPRLIPFVIHGACLSS